MKKTRSTNRNSAVEITGATVSVRGDDVNSALRKLKKILESDNRQKDLAKHESYEKPSVRRKRSRDQARKRTQREREQEFASGTAKKPVGLKWMKSKRKRRQVLDADDLFRQAQRKAKKRS